MSNKIMISTYNLLINHHIWMSEPETCWCFASNRKHFAHHVWIKGSQYIWAKPCKNTCLNETCPRVTGMGKKTPVLNHKTTAYTPTCFLVYSRKYGRGKLDVKVNGRKRFTSSIITTLTFILLILRMTVMLKIHKICGKSQDQQNFPNWKWISQCSKTKIHYPLNQFPPSTFWLFHYVNVKREDCKSSIILYASSGTPANMSPAFSTTSSQCSGIIILRLKSKFATILLKKKTCDKFLSDMKNTLL